MGGSTRLKGEGVRAAEKRKGAQNKVQVDE